MITDILFLDKNTCYFCKSEKTYKLKLCRNCYDKLDYVDNTFKIESYKAHAIYFYNDFAKKLIGDYKFERKTSISRIFSEAIYRYCVEKNLFDVDFILPSPCSKKTLIYRGFDHIRMITDDFIGDIRPEYLSSFKKIRNTKAQHELGKKDRISNLKNAFFLETDLESKSVLIIDDLITTGNTAKEIIRVLENKNVGNIEILALFSEKRVL